MSFLNYRKITEKKKNTERSQRGKKQLTYKGTKIRTAFKFSSDTMHAEDSAVNKMLREKNTDVEFCAMWNYPSKVSMVCVCIHYRLTVNRYPYLTVNIAHDWEQASVCAAEGNCAAMAASCGDAWISGRTEVCLYHGAEQ